ncbi:hypothetical protein ACNPQM_29520 [Streptomyces sp. NPDC056231]|uniref:hypothetical protein n=1 Tax=Streptomyces sp. NPDC056231 TaxID=3345755 RepID=UPI003AAEBCA0
MFTDLYSNQPGLLAEVKGSVTRENVRMAIGQLADCSRFVVHTTRAILLPSRPRMDLLNLAESQGCVVIRPEGATYGSSEPNLVL